MAFDLGIFTWHSEIVSVSRHHSPGPRTGAVRHRTRPRVSRTVAGAIVPSRIVENRWRTIRYAIGSNARTARLCIIILVAGVPLDTFIVLRLLLLRN